MAQYTEIDLLVDASGDLVLDSSKNFEFANSRETLQQDIAFRAATEYNDFEPHPDVGADLQALLGEPNSRENAALGERKLFTSLTKDGRIIPQDLRVKAVPISMHQIAIYTFVNSSNEDVNVFTAAVLDYENGIFNTPGGGQ
jgi:hypothetical protein